MKARLVLPVIAALAALALAGCGGSSGSSDPATLAPADTPLYVQVLLRPQGQLKKDVETLTSTVSGFSDPIGELIDFLNRSMNEKPTLNGKKLSFANDIDPWLGRRAGVFLEGLAGEPPTAGIIQTTDVDAAQAFIDNSKQQGDKDRSYEGVDYLLDGDSDLAVGMVDDFLVLGSERAFKDAVDVADDGDSLADRDEFTDALDEAPAGSLADAYVDVGLAIDQSGESIDDQALQILKAGGIDPTKATVLGSVVPTPDQVEVSFSSDLGGEESPPTGDASQLLSSLPADSFVALAFPGIGEQLKAAIDRLDARGIPGEVPPDQLKSTLARAGIDLDQIAGSIGDAALFAEGSDENSLGGALVLTARDAIEATNTVSNIKLLLRASGAPGVSAVSGFGGRASGFAIRDKELGPRLLVVVAMGDRIAIGYGLGPALQGVSANDTPLAETPAFADAVASLGATPIGGFVDGPATLRLVEGLGATSDPDFRSARPYLRKVDFLAFGTGGEEDLTTSKLIVGFGK
ncbi:MAG TPA: DUF3352 domain-containing protein [Solirubrobacterales bacterium]